MTAHKRISSADRALEKIERYLDLQGGRMTCVRRDIVRTMAGFEGAKTAYQILSAANKNRKTKLSPISVYRTLQFLTDAGVVLKIESQNAYELCRHREADHSHLLMICDKCGNVREIEAPGLSKTLLSAAKKHGHKLKHHVIELHGTCRDC